MPTRSQSESKLTNDSTSWKQVWEDKSKENVPDFELDRGMSPRDQETENLSEQELLSFAEPQAFDTLLDAGCGTGVNILRFHSRVKKIIGFDYAWGSVDRCRRKIQAHEVKNAGVCVASVAAVPLPDHSVNRIVCLSVLQYLNDEEVRGVLREFVRVLVPGGTIVLHVKNSSSLYWSTLRVAKKLKAFLGWSTGIYYLRPFRWYVNTLESLNCGVVDYNSFNFLIVDGMPKKIVSLLQGLELRHRNRRLLRTPFVRRHGAELKIRATVLDRDAH